MNKKGLTQIQSVGIGALIGVSGFIFMSFGAVLSNNTFLRLGVISVTIATWMIGWSK